MDIQEVWDKLISTIKSYPGVNPSQLDAFFSRIQIQAVSPGFIMLTSCTAFVKEWVERHYMKDIQRALEDIMLNSSFRSRLIPLLKKQKE